MIENLLASIIVLLASLLTPGSLSFEQAVAIDRAFAPSQWAWAVRTSFCESGFHSDVVNKESGTVGLFQTHPLHLARFSLWGADLTNPFVNSLVARAILDVDGKDAWDC